MKKCTRCLEVKPYSEFHRNKNYPDGYHFRCKICRKLSAVNPKQGPSKQSPDLLAAGVRICYICNIPKKIDTHFYPSDPYRCKICSSKRRVEYGRETKTGWTPEDYNAAYKKQEGCCAICGEYYDVLTADHCHASKKKRKLLCSECNLMLGKAKDNPQVLLAAIHYLVESGKASPFC